MSDEIPPPRPAPAAPSPPGLDARLDRVLHVFTAVSLASLALGLAASLVWPEALAVRGLLHAGIILLLASPGSRLVVIIAVHAQTRQWGVVTMAAVTLAIMMGSLVAGLVALWRG